MPSLKFIIITSIMTLIFTYSVQMQEVATIQLGVNRKEIILKLDSIQAIERDQQTLLSTISNYSLYEIENADDPIQMRGVLQSNFSGTVVCSFDCARINIPLINSLGYNKTFVLKINGLVLDRKPVRPIRFEVKPEASIVSSIERTRGKIRVQSVSPVEELNRFVSVKETVLKISKDGDKVISVPKTTTGEVVDSINTNELTIKLDDKLGEGKTHNLAIESGLNDGDQTPITASGKVIVAGLPTPLSVPPIEVKLSSLAAVGQAPFFDLFASISLPKPWNLDGKGRWYLEPKVSVDVGLGDTKSNNSIIFNLPFRTDINTLGQIKDPTISDINSKKSEVAKLPNYYRWRKTPFYQLSSIEFRAGPKFESDRKFGRINALGAIRLDFRFSRWEGSMADQRSLLKKDLKEKADQVSVKHGFRLVPYLNFDFGRKVTGEVVENTDKGIRIVVPQNSIARTQLGFVNLIEWSLFSLPMSLTIDESLGYLFKPETIGTVTDDGVDLRVIRGFQHRGKASFDVFLGSAKRYSFNVTFENGRSAPNFEYLNKLTTGFRFQY